MCFLQPRISWTPAPNLVLSSLIKKFLEREKERRSEGTAVKKSWVCTPHEEGGEGQKKGSRVLRFAWVPSKDPYLNGLVPSVVLQGGDGTLSRSSFVGSPVPLGVPSRAIVEPWYLPVALLTSWVTRWEAWSGTHACHAVPSQQRPRGIMDRFFQIHEPNKPFHL